MPNYVISYQKTEDGYQFSAKPVDSAGESYLIGFEFGSPQDAEAIAMDLNAQGATPESAYTLVPGIAQKRKAPIVNPGTDTPQQAPGSKPVQPGDDGQIAWETELEAAERKANDPAYAKRTVTGTGSSMPAFDPRSPDGSPSYQPPVYQNINEPGITGGEKEQRKKVYAEAAFNDTTARTLADGTVSPMNRSTGGVPGGSPVGTNSVYGSTPVTDPMLEADILSGNMDPRRAVSLWLETQGLDTHANRGFLEQGYGNYENLYNLANPGVSGFESPVDMHNAALDFAGGLGGTTNGTATRVDTRGLYDNMFTDPFASNMQSQYDLAASEGGAPEQHQFEFDTVMSSIQSLGPYIGESNMTHLAALTNQAYEEYMNSQERSGGMTFTTYLRDVKQADSWY